MKEIVKYLVKVVQVASKAWCRRKGQDPESESNEEGKNSLSLVSHVRNDLDFSTQQNETGSVVLKYYVQLSAVAG